MIVHMHVCVVCVSVCVCLLEATTRIVIFAMFIFRMSNCIIVELFERFTAYPAVLLCFDYSDSLSAQRQPRMTNESDKK